MICCCCDCNIALQCNWIHVTSCQSLVFFSIFLIFMFIHRFLRRNAHFSKISMIFIYLIYSFNSIYWKLFLNLMTLFFLLPLHRQKSSGIPLIVRKFEKENLPKCPVWKRSEMNTVNRSLALYLLFLDRVSLLIFAVFLPFYSISLFSAWDFVWDVFCEDLLGFDRF